MKRFETERTGNNDCTGELYKSFTIKSINSSNLSGTVQIALEKSLFPPIIKFNTSFAEREKALFSCRLTIYLIKKGWDKMSKSEIEKDGSFKRQKSLFSTRFGERSTELPVEKDRYHLIWTPPCPWSHRAVIVREILGLHSAISLGTVDPIRPNVPRVDWAFTLDKNEVDPILGIKYLSEIYERTDPNYTGRPTVPAMVDNKKQQVVNNDYFTLTNDFETVWSPFHKEQAPNLYPQSLRTQIDALNEIIYDEVNNGVYKCGFARSQAAYEQAYDILFDRLEKLDQQLAEQRFLFGDFITDADVRLYVTLARFDVAYYSAFNTNKKRLIDFPNLWEYARDLYSTPGFGNTTDFEAIKKHYHLSITLSSNDKQEEKTLPKGPNLAGWEIQSNRQYLSKSAEKFLIV